MIPYGFGPREPDLLQDLPKRAKIKLSSPSLIFMAAGIDSRRLCRCISQRSSAAARSIAGPITGVAVTVATYRELFALVVKRPRMYLIRETSRPWSLISMAATRATPVVC